MDDGIRDMTYAEFIRALEECGIGEDLTDDETPIEIQGCRFIVRQQRMGVGSPYYPVIYEGDIAIVSAPTIRRVLGCFGVVATAFLNAAAAA